MLNPIGTLNPEQEKVWREFCKRMKPFTDLMIHYKEFVDKDLSRYMTGYPEYWETTVSRRWYKSVTPILSKLPKEGYDNNILFICNENIMGKVFFSAFANLPKFVDFRYMDSLSIRDLWNGKIGKSDYFPEDFETVRSWRDVNEDVLCTSVSGSIAKNKTGDIPEILQTIIALRYEKHGRRTYRQNTWIYFDGTIEELRDSGFSIWESFFNRYGLIIDLNPQENQNDFVTADIYSPF